MTLLSDALAGVRYDRNSVTHTVHPPSPDTVCALFGYTRCQVCQHRIRRFDTYGWVCERRCRCVMIGCIGPR